MTPSLPTFSIASAIFSPTSLSPLAEMMPTWAISDEPETAFDWPFSVSTTLVTAMSMPRFRSIGFMPAATDFMPSRTIAWARTVAVVVPSPALSFALLATSRSICAPIFSNLSLSSISLATVTPSLVMRGAPKLLSITTLRPLGPRVTFTASARVSTPLRMRSRASRLNLTSLAAIYASFRFRRKLRNFTLKSGFRRIGGTGSGDDAENVRFLHDQQLFAVDLDFGARPFRSEEHTSELQSLMRNSYAVFCLKNKKKSMREITDHTHQYKYTN